MNRLQLEHLIRACGNIIKDARGADGPEADIVVVGSQSILGRIPDAPEQLTMSMEADIRLDREPNEVVQAVEAVLGELSDFHDLHGIYAQTAAPETATLPRSWRERLVTIHNENTGGARALCLDPHDLALSKYFADRDKDRDFNRELIKLRLVDFEQLSRLLEEMPIDPARRQLITDRIAGDFAKYGPDSLSVANPELGNERTAPRRRARPDAKF